MLDREVGELLEVLPPDAVRILMSDHGARAMVGGVCFNDWLRGYLALSEPLTGRTAIAQAPSTGPGRRPGAMGVTTGACSST